MEPWKRFIIRSFPLRQKGSSMAWTAITLSLLVMPLLAMVTDGSRLLYVRSRLQTATDAACEDAAWSAADYAAYRDSGDTTFQDNWFWIGRAQATFNQSLQDQFAIQYSAWVDIRPDFDRAYMNCSSAAQVPLLTGGGLVASPVNIHASSSSKIRFRSQP